MNSEPIPRPPLDGTRLDEALGEVGAVRVEIVAEATSTNALVVDRARDGAADGLAIVAEHQTAGRGRLDRRWETPARSGLTFSLLLRPSAPPARWPWLPLLTGYAVGEALREAGYDAVVKWPNDVLIGDGKVAGILVERVETPDGPAAVIGVGLNTDLSVEELPVPGATALSLASGTAPDRIGLLAAVLISIRETYDQWDRDEDATRLGQAYTRACVTLGQRVRVDLPDGSTLLGDAVAIDADGRLVIDADGVDGRVRQVVGAGDVVHVRPIDPNQ